MKKLLALLLAVCVVMGCAGTACGEEIADTTLASALCGFWKLTTYMDVWYNPDTGDYNLHFNGITEPLEGDQYLIWSRRSMEEIAPLFPYDPGTLEEKTDTRMYWTEIGAGDRGYVLVERVDENWYYIEYNYPT